MHQKYTLKNDLKVILIPQKNTKAVTFLVLFKVGSRYEPAHLAGASHFIEHLMFKGTKRRPTTLDISRELDGIGAEYNAFTDKDHTGYFVKCAAEYFDLGVDILSDMLFHSKFDKSEVEREKNVIVEEIRMYLDDPMMHIEDVIENLVFEGNTLGRDIAGSQKTVLSINREKMLDFKSQYYNPSNTLVVAAGNLKDNALKIIKNSFEDFAAQGKKGKDFSIFGKKQSSSRFDFLKRKTEQLQLAMGFPAYKYLDKKLPALALFSTIFGGTMSSRLFTEVRERRGLAYSVHSGIRPYQDTGIFLIRAGLDPKRFNEASEVIFKEIEKVKKSGVLEAELKRAKKTTEGRMALALENSSAVASFYGQQALLTDIIKTPEEKLKEIQKVTLADIKKVANEILDNKKMSIATISAIKKPLEVKKITF